MRVGWIGLAVGVVALWMGRRHWRKMLVEFDWDSFLFVAGIFVLIWGISKYGLLEDWTHAIADSGIRSPGFLLAFITWVSTLLSAVIDNVPFTILMIPVCRDLAALTGLSAWPLLYGMLVGTGLGGNITPVGATANVFACGLLEKHGHKVRFLEYAKISVPFTLAAVGTAHLLLHWIWLAG
jgi:Na+/H+ antiporter NhaD/arsenite permease-like protein